MQQPRFELLPIIGDKYDGVPESAKKTYMDDGEIVSIMPTTFDETLPVNPIAKETIATTVVDEKKSPPYLLILAAIVSYLIIKD